MYSRFSLYTTANVSKKRVKKTEPDALVCKVFVGVVLELYRIHESVGQQCLKITHGMYCSTKVSPVMNQRVSIASVGIQI